MPGSVFSIGAHERGAGSRLRVCGAAVAAVTHGDPAADRPSRPGRPRSSVSSVSQQRGSRVAVSTKKSAVGRKRTSTVEVAVLGAGPHGLAATAHLRRAGVDVRIIGDPMSFWQTMPTRL